MLDKKFVQNIFRKKGETNFSSLGINKKTKESEDQKLIHIPFWYYKE